jgi:cytochrome c oxidase cbb3-type subunit I
LMNTPALAHKLGLQADADPVAFIRIVEIMSNYLMWRSISGMLIFVGHIAFAVSVIWMLLKRRPAESTAPTLFRNPPEMEIAAR